VTRQRASAPSAWNLTGTRVAEIPVMRCPSSRSPERIHPAPSPTTTITTT